LAQFALQILAVHAAKQSFSPEDAYRNWAGLQRSVDCRGGTKHAATSCSFAQRALLKS